MRSTLLPMAIDRKAGNNDASGLQIGAPLQIAVVLPLFICAPAILKGAIFLKRFEVLVLDDLRDSAHRAFLDAVATGNAGVLVHDLGDTIDNLENVLRASVDADSATNALISFNNWM